MSILPSADRARARYAAALYHSALLRDPNPEHAGRAVVGAFRAIPWDDVALDDHLEARLVASLPPLPRLYLRRRARSITGLPSAFWKLPPNARLGLGLRLLRGLGTMQIAQALRIPLPDTQALLLDSLRALSGEREPLPEACRHCFMARLDIPNAQGDHLLTCAACRASVPRWERMEGDLAEQLGRAVGGLPLPQAVDEALRTALDSADYVTPLQMWRRPAFLQSAILVCTLLGLIMLVLPRRTTKPATATSPALTPAAIVAAARSNYAAVPPVAGILHRHWAITLGQPQLNFEADEWVDPQQPARHRMQLVANKATAEWQIGDGQQHLVYMSNLDAQFCGSVPLGVKGHTNERDSWLMSPAEQTTMRVARWQHGPWATGLHYLEIAATADTLRSLGIGGNGADATLTLAAEGHTISGTLLLRFDPTNHTLREVHELRRNNGQTEDHVPWRLVSSETLPEETVLQHDLLTSYPSDNRPPLVERSLPVIDQRCPLAGAEQTQSLPRLLARLDSGSGAVIGLPALPPGLEQGMLVGTDDPLAAHDFTETFQLQFNTTHVVYVGPAKRLQFLPEVPAIAHDQPVRAGPWLVHFLPQEVPTIIPVVIEHVDLLNPQVDDSLITQEANWARVIAEGWTRDELLAVLATARPLHFEDWVNTPERFYEAVPLDADTRARLMLLYTAARPHLGQTHHLIKITNTRQPSFFAALRDPYHTPPELWPPMRREESWIEYDTDGKERRALQITSDLTGHVMYGQWHDSHTMYTYNALGNSVISNTSQFFDFGGFTEDRQPLYGAFRWQWHTLSDGTQVAEQPYRIQSAAIDPNGEGASTWSLDYWAADLRNNIGIERKTFDTQGSLHKQEIVAVPPTGTETPSNLSLDQHHLATAVARNGIALLAPSPPITINTITVQQNEWLDHVPDSTFTWIPPSGTHLLTQAEFEVIFQPDHQTEFVDNLAATAAMPFPVLNWVPDVSAPEAKATFSAAELHVPTGKPPVVLQGTLSDALHYGVAVKLSYLLNGRSITLIEGPAPALQQLLRQTAPPWTTAEQRTISVGGTALLVWIMQGASDATNHGDRWIVWEMSGTLFYMHANLSDVELDVLIKHFGTFQRVLPSQHS